LSSPGDDSQRGAPEGGWSMVESQGAGIEAGDTMAPQANGIGAKTMSRHSPAGPSGLAGNVTDWCRPRRLRFARGPERPLIRSVFARTRAEMFLRESARCRSSLEHFVLKQRRGQGGTLRVVSRGTYCEADVSIGILVDKERTIFRVSHCSLQ